MATFSQLFFRSLRTGSKKTILFPLVVKPLCTMVMQSEYVRISFPAALVPELAFQAPAHEIAPAALQQKQHQLQLKCEGAGQAAHSIAEAASRTGRAGTCTFAPAALQQTQRQ
jgi:hypothetical protein